MRTPWRFLSDLVTRKPTDDQVDDHSSEGKVNEPQKLPSPDQAGDLDLVATEGSVDHNAIEISPVAADEAPESNPAETEIATSDDRVTAVEEVAAAEGGPDENDGPVEAVYTLGVANSDELDEAEVAISKPVATSKKAKPSRVAEGQAAGNAEVAVSKTDGEAKTFVDEMAELDAEISSLRKQLSEKLIAQNEQLRKMVQRFDRT